MRRHLFAALTSCLTALAAAQGVPTLPELRSVTDGVMIKVGGGDIEAGLRAFKSLTIIPEAEFDAMLGQARLQFPALTARFGLAAGQEFISETRIGDSLARLTYISKHEKHAMRWVFYCYKGKNGWVINTFRFDDKWPELFGS